MLTEPAPLGVSWSKWHAGLGKEHRPRFSGAKVDHPRQRLFPPPSFVSSFFPLATLVSCLLYLLSFLPSSLLSSLPPFLPSFLPSSYCRSGSWLGLCPDISLVNDSQSWLLHLPPPLFIALSMSWLQGKNSYPSTASPSRTTLPRRKGHCVASLIYLQAPQGLTARSG